MSFKSKRTISSMIVGIILAVAYVIYALSKNAPSSDDMSKWAQTMLIFIGISIAASIVLQIAFHIFYSIGIAIKEREKDDKEVERIIESEMKEDELDKYVELKSSRVGYIVCGIGLVVALVWLAFFGTAMIVSMHIILGAAFAGAFVEGCLSIRYYERGI